MQDIAERPRASSSELCYTCDCCWELERLMGSAARVTTKY